jgi:hypothetical protein
MERNANKNFRSQISTKKKKLIKLQKIAKTSLREGSELQPTTTDKLFKALLRSDRQVACIRNKHRIFATETQSKEKIQSTIKRR